jgi:bacteriorhodopsin
VTGASTRQFRSAQYKFVVAGLLMIWTGYVGQYFEATNMAQLWVWGGISTAFYLYVLWVVYGVISDGRRDAPREASQVLGVVWALILISWTLYPIAYAIPGMVSRQIIFTMADITSKVIYGVLIGQVAQIRSSAEGYEPAIQAVGPDAEKGAW